MVISHINRDQLTKIEPHYTVHPHTTLLFVDISGYTALAQKLGSEGTLGTEKLSKVRTGMINYPNSNQAVATVLLTLEGTLFRHCC